MAPASFTLMALLATSALAASDITTMQPSPAMAVRLQRGGTRSAGHHIHKVARMIVEGDATLLGIVLQSTGQLEDAFVSPLDAAQSSRVGKTLLRLRGGLSHGYYPKLTREAAIHRWALRFAARLVG